MIKHIEDYYDKIKEKFPDLEMWEIQKICTHGFRSMHSLCNHGADVLISNSNKSFSVYIGKTFANDDLFYKYFNLKKRIKTRIKYFIKKPIWDGYYYFGLTEEEYRKYIPVNKSGRWKQKVKFDFIRCFKIYEEAFLTKKIKYVFRLKLDSDRGISFHEENFETRNFDLYAKRDSKGQMKLISD